MKWQAFVIAHGGRARTDHLAHVLGRPAGEIQCLRSRGVCAQRSWAEAKHFAELFTLWHGRPPADEDWPAPKRSCSGHYEWLLPELALAASLVGRISTAEIAQALTARLQKITGDATAERSRNSAQLAINRIGLISTDVLGGLTIEQAAKETGSRQIIYDAIANKTIEARRIGRLWLISREALDAWKATRSLPPEGYVRLATLRERLGIRSDAKLPEYASRGYIPTAVRCNPYGGGGTSRYGSWYLAPDVAEQLLADRAAGLPMPWYGKPMADNLRTTWKLLQQRKHPASCAACKDIWGEAGAPVEFEDYQRRYPPLDLGAKRHLTWRWNPGFTLPALASQSGRSVAQIKSAIDAGLLRATKVGRITYVSRTDATRWKARRYPIGTSEKSWLSLDSAITAYGFSEEQLREFVAGERLNRKIGTHGAMRGVEYFARQQLTELRQAIGYSEAEAAERAGVSIERLRALLHGTEWRQAEAIPLAAIHTVIKRIASARGYTFAAAAHELGTTEEWISEQVRSGTTRLASLKWDRSIRYLSAPMLERLRIALQQPQQVKRLPEEWLHLSQAAAVAGVSINTLMKWAEAGEVTRQQSDTGWRYLKPSVQARARRYWPQVRFKRAVAPDWYQQEFAASAASMEVTHDSARA